METYQKTILDNGIVVITETLNFVDSFSLGLWFNTGSRDENEKNNGISHFIEHMFFKDTRKYSTRDISYIIESLGGYLNAFTTKEHTCIYGRGMKQNLSKTFEVLAEMCNYPLFTNEDIETESKVILDELYDIDDSPEELIFDNFEKNIFEGNSISFPVIGTVESINSLSQSDLIEYYKNNYLSNEFYIIAVGNIEHNELLDNVVKYFGNASNKTKNTRKPYIQTEKKDEIIEKDFQQNHKIIGCPTYGINNENRLKVSILSSILGEGSSSRLFYRLREQNGIAYQINTFYNLFYDTSAFGVYLSTNKDSMNKAEDLIFSEFKNIKSKKIDELELNRAKEFLKGQIVFGLEKLTNRMSRIAQYEIYFSKIFPVKTILNEIDKITVKDILDISNEVLNEDNLSKMTLV